MITAVLIARNEESRISAWIDQMSWCNEILVIDNASTDSTADIASQRGARVMSLESSDFSHLRNYVMQQAKSEWIVYVDGDEIVPASLIEEIKSACVSNTSSAYRLRREDIFWGSALHHGEVRVAFKKGIIRLVKKDSGEWKGAVHEEFSLKNGTEETLQTPLIHFAHDGMSDFLHAINRYSTIRADELISKGVHASVFDILVRPFVKFIYTYFILMGFRDGAGGFVYSFMMSFHAFLVRSKMYLKTAK